MPFCPNCRYEYREGMVTCPECNEKLVPVIAEEAVNNLSDTDKPDHDWVQIARLSSREYAEMVVEVWRARQIPAVIHSGTGHFGITGQMGPSSFRPIGGGYSLMVPREHVAEADQEAALILGDEWEKSKLIDIDNDPGSHNCSG